MHKPSLDLSSVQKGKLSLAEALHDLDAVKKAFEISDRIESRLSAQDHQIQSLLQQSSSFTSYTFLSSRLEEFKQFLTKFLSEKFEDFSSHYISQLTEKLNKDDLETHLSTRCTWASFNSLNQSVNSLKSRLDKHILTDFEGLKTKLKVQFGDKHIQIMNEAEKIKEDFSQVKMRMAVVEQKLNELFMDDGLGESEDYDSQEANDNILQNLEKNKDSLETESDGEAQKEVKSHELSAIPSSVETGDSSLRTEGNKLGVSKVADQTVEETKVSNKITVSLLIEAEKSVNELQSEHESLQRSNALEIPDKSSRRRDEDAASSRHKHGGGSSRSGLSRRNSLTSSLAAGNGQGGLRNVNKKLIVLTKDIENLRLAIDEYKPIIDEIKSEFAVVYDKISAVRGRCEEIETVRQGMEMSFIKALRRSGKDKPSAAKVQIASISSEELRKLQAQISERSKKLAAIEILTEKLALDMQQLKASYRDKNNEIIQAIHLLDYHRKESLKESKYYDERFIEFEQQLQSLGSSVLQEVEQIKGPMTDLISDQKRENEILEEDLKRQQVSMRGMLEECTYSSRLLPEPLIQSRVSILRPQTQKSIDSPRVSLKHKYFDSNNSFRLSNPNIKTEDNWLSGFPDGKSLALPKVGTKKSSRSLAVTDRKPPDPEVKKRL